MPNPEVPAICVEPNCPTCAVHPGIDFPGVSDDEPALVDVLSQLVLDVVNQLSDNIGSCVEAAYEHEDGRGHFVTHDGHFFDLTPALDADLWARLLAAKADIET